MYTMFCVHTWCMFIRTWFPQMRLKRVHAEHFPKKTCVLAHRNDTPTMG